MASLKVLSDRNQYLQQVWILDEDLVRSRCLATFLDDEVITLPLFGGFDRVESRCNDRTSQNLRFPTSLSPFAIWLQNMTSSCIQVAYSGDAAGLSSRGTRPVLMTRAMSIYVPITYRISVRARSEKCFFAAS